MYAALNRVKNIAITVQAILQMLIKQSMTNLDTVLFYYFISFYFIIFGTFQIASIIDYHIFYIANV